MTSAWQFLSNETATNGTKFRGENDNLSTSSDVLHKIANLVISRRHFAYDGEETEKKNKNENARVERAEPLFLLTKYVKLTFLCLAFLNVILPPIL